MGVPKYRQQFKDKKSPSLIKDKEGDQTTTAEEKLYIKYYQNKIHELLKNKQKLKDAAQILEEWLKK